MSYLKAWRKEQNKIQGSTWKKTISQRWPPTRWNDSVIDSNGHLQTFVPRAFDFEMDVSNIN